MAEVSKLPESHFRRNRVKYDYSRELQDKFKRLACPYTESADETWISELIFNPGEPRIKILQWLLSRFNSSVYNFLEPIYAGTEPKLKAILHAASALGLCRASDIDLIQGKSSMNKQMAFMDKLLNLCLTADETGSICVRSHLTYDTSESAMEQYTKDCGLLDRLAQQQSVSELFPSSHSILPIDVKKAIDLTAMASNADQDERSLSSMPELSERLKLLQEDLYRQRQLLDSLSNEHTCNMVDKKSRETQLRKLRLILSELQQMIVNCCYCYESHIQPWCSRSSPSLSALGDRIHSVQRLLNSFTTVLGAMKVIRVSHDKLESFSQGFESVRPEKPVGTHYRDTDQMLHLYETLDSLERSISLLSQPETIN
ncbi:HAUS augmin-like complex subunit 7 [Watersipora subatra]|uniref:HAUS augmin-like complex subunit 7 n=1 Tax=Watersipora subatra TaxID=2589382 RepID=UPI00355B61F0